jgi:hypothetical protein
MSSGDIAVTAIIIAVPLLAFVCYPLYRRPVGQAASDGSSALSEREQNARQALSEVEFDFQLGNLDEQDYRLLRTRYINRTLTALKARRTRTQEIDEQIELEVRRLREEEEERGS